MKRWSFFLLMILMLALAGSAGAVPPPPAPLSSTYFLYSQWGGTWQDANKNGQDDSLMCWAGAASNVLEWGNWDTEIISTTTAIFQHFKNHWTNGAGFANWGWKWWFNGSPPPVNRYAYIDVPGGGNFFPGEDFYSYTTSAATGDMLAKMDSLMHQGYGVTLSIKKGTASHAVTGWGFGYDLIDGLMSYKSVYITDSDDGRTGLMNYALTWNSGWYLGGTYSGWKITGLYALKFNPWEADGKVTAAPIASSLVLMASGLAFLGVLGRRLKGTS